MKRALIPFIDTSVYCKIFNLVVAQTKGIFRAEKIFPESVLYQSGGLPLVASDKDVALNFQILDLDYRNALHSQAFDDFFRDETHS